MEKFVLFRLASHSSDGTVAFDRFPVRLNHHVKEEMVNIEALKQNAFCTSS